MQKHLLALAVIVTASTGCDNVAWGGASIELRGPPETQTTVEPSEDETPTETVSNVDGPLLLAGVRVGERADFVLVGEVLPDRLEPFPNPDFAEDQERLGTLTQPGAEWVLFSEGVRVGRMTVEASSPQPGYCADRIGVSGVVELIPSAAEARRLLAMPAESTLDRPYEPYRSFTHDYDQRVASIAIATETLRSVGATWPEGGVLSARDSITVYQLRNAPGMSIAATFTRADDPTTSAPGAGAYSLFMIGEENGDEYLPTFTWFRSVDDEGKGVPSYVDHLDWNGDGTDEILLDVFGSNRRWFAVLSRAEGGWVRSYQDSCGSSGP